MSWRLIAIALLATGCSEYDLTDGTEGEEVGNDTDGTDPDGDGDPDVVEGDGGVRGRICAPSENTYVSGATVWVDVDGTLITTTTDADGWFTLEGLPTGDHVVHVEKGSFATEFTVAVTDGEITELAVEECFSADDVAIAVVTGQYDSIQVVLDHLGFDYTLINGVSGSGHVNLLRSPTELEKYDVIFFNCGMSDAWTSYQSEIASNIRDYVQNGGSVYTSDWSYFLAEVAYPDMIDYVGEDAWSGSAYVGMPGMVHGTVKDPAMITALGSDQAELNYDLDAWAAPLSLGTGAKTLINGSFDYFEGWSTSTANGPLAARMKDGNGQILYTSFHNEQQSTLDMDVLLQEIILSL